MRKRYNIKSKLAGMLAAVMVFSMAVPGHPAYAVDFGDLVKIKFNPQNGPGVQLSSYSGVASGGAMEGNLFVASGQAGSPLTSSANFAGLPTDDFGSGARPKVPDFNGITWDGYTFDGWYGTSGNRVETLPYAFPYDSVTTYNAVWKSNETTPYTFRVEHYRDFNTARDEADGSSGWPADYEDPDLRKFFESSWESTQMANNPISATYRRDIPGYRFKSVLLKNNKVRKYGEASGQGTMEEGGASINTSTNAVRGSMPNDSLTAAYRYEPDPAKKFQITVRYVDMEGNQIKAPESRTLPVESGYVIEPAVINSYLLESAELTDGGITDLDGMGVISAEDAGVSLNTSDYYFTGKMPNQAITFTYQYGLDPSFETILRVKRMDNHGNILREEETRAVNPGVPVEVDVDEMPGYVYPPNIVWEDSLSEVSLNQETKKLNLTPNLQGGTVTITYTEDLTDENYWAKVEFYNGQNGFFNGSTAPKFVKKSGDNTLAQVTEGLIPTPSSHYSFDGWYKATSNGSNKTGPKLADDTVINTSIKLFANFEETEGEWFDLKFVSGPHGAIEGNKTSHVEIGTSWSSLILPSTHPDNFYMFDGWFDENGNRMQGPQTINADQTYTARFIPIGLSDDNILTMPDAQGTIGSDGSGKVGVSGANQNRRYALTDMDYKVVGTKLGSQLKNAGFTGLNPCTSYYVYEMIQGANPDVGVILPENLDPGTFSPPSRVTVPALGSNYDVQDDGTGMKQVVVEPADPGTLYAILNIEGDVMDVPGADEDGWVMSSGATPRAVLGGLESNQLYVVVAKQPGEDTGAADKILLGTQVAVIGNSQEQQDYTIALTNGGFITKIVRGGVTVDFDDDKTAVVKAGDLISLDAETTNSQGQAFRQWSALIGRLTLADKTRRNPTITMPEGNLVLQANYYAAVSAATPGNASIDYTPKTGAVALDLSDDRMADLIDGLTDNSSDQDAMTAGVDVLYTVKFTQRAPKASESEAAKAEVGNDAVKVPWTLSSVLTRQVGGSNKDIPPGVDKEPDIRIYAVLDRSMRGYTDYQLWNVEDLDGEYTCTQVPMEPDPDDADSGFTGVVSFDANVEGTYVLTYLKAHEVRIIDDKRSVEHIIKVRSGTALEDAQGFMDLDIFDAYTDPITGVVWEYNGLGRTASSNNGYDTGEPVTKNLTLHVLYQMEDDTQWQEARQKLLTQISIAQALKDNPSVSEEDKEELSDAIDIALEVANRIYRPTVDELLDTYDTLKALVDSITSGGNDPNDPNPPDNPDDPDHPDNPDNPNRPGGNGGGGGGGSRGGSGGGRSLGPGTTFNDYRTYAVGTEGRWESIGTDGRQWSFILRSGRTIKDQWINIKYEDARQTCTYHFNAAGIMDYGWYMDAGGHWYYLNDNLGADFGRLVMGWYYDAKDMKWYYLNQFTGGMATGWQKLGEYWYFFSTGGQDGRPMGTLYVNEMTPDGYPVDENGRWMRETP